MIYHAIGLMSGSSLDGLDIVCARLEEVSGRWTYEIVAAGCLEYTPEWQKRLMEAPHIAASDYFKLHADYGRYTGEKVNEFIAMNGLEHKIALIASHGHTTFHNPAEGYTHQLGDGAAIAAETHLPVVSDLRAVDVALGGEGAPIVPMGEKLLFEEYSCFLNIGGIANISIDGVAYDVCPANRVLNMLAREAGKTFDARGAMAATGSVHPLLLEELNALPYYEQPHPKSLANSFGIDTVYPLISQYLLSPEDALATYVEHIAMQVAASVGQPADGCGQMLVTGGGAFNDFLIGRMREHLLPVGMEVVVPNEETVAYKEALIMALLGILRWREQETVLAAVTGARRDSVGGALWLS